MSKKNPPRWPFRCGDIVPGTITRFAEKGVARATLLIDSDTESDTESESESESESATDSATDSPGVELRVSGGVPGDKGLFKITHTGKNAAWGAIEELKEPSPDRVEAPCPVVMRCGGCPWQMVSTEAQRKLRMERIEVELGEVLGAAERHEWANPVVETDFRTRALMMAVKRRGALRLGFYAPGTRRLVEAESCDVQHPIVNQTLAAARKILDNEEMTTYGGPERKGLLKALLFRVDPGIGRGLLTMVVSRWHHTLSPIAEKLGAIPTVLGVHANISERDSGPVLGEETRHLNGQQTQAIRYGSLELEVGPTAFLQTHHEAAQSLVERVGALLPDRMEHLVDLYAGVGVFGLAYRDRARRVTLVERMAEAAEAAASNAKRLEAKRVKVIRESAETYLLSAREGEGAPDALILDPPRSGCSDEVIGVICDWKHAMRLLYVSCGLPSLARDLRKLREGGFEVTDLVPIDMFPHTPHQEVVVGLRKVGVD
jgi:23S rRNA (uracil1939-C5)-methyltransferase